MPSKNHGLKLSLLAFGVLLCASLVAAQAVPSGTNSNSTAPRRGQNRPCWQQAGVSQSVMQQRRSLEQNTRSEIESVCADSSLSQQQKHQKIQQIHAQARQQIQGMMTPQQEEALKSCRAQRGEGRHEGGGSGGRSMHEGGGRGQGPCGEMAGGGRGSRSSTSSSPRGGSSSSDMDEDDPDR